MTPAERASYLRSTGLYSEREIRERVERIATRKVLEQIAAISNLHPTFAQALKETANMTIRGYDDWKLASPYVELTSAEEDLANALDDAQDEIKKLKAALGHVTKWLEDRSDVDCDEGVWVPNEENRLLAEIDQLVQHGKVL